MNLLMIFYFFFSKNTINKCFLIDIPKFFFLFFKHFVSKSDYNNKEGNEMKKNEYIIKIEDK